MMFCPKCGSLLIPKKEGKNNVLSCSCGYKDKSKEKLSLKEEVKQKIKDVEVASDSEESLPVTDAECKKCKNTQAYFWLVQTRAGDEPETKFLKCTKCKHTWRDYS